MDNNCFTQIVLIHYTIFNSIAIQKKGCYE